MLTRLTTCTVLFVLVLSARVHGFGVINEDGNGIAMRWDAAPRTVSGNERSLDGGLRYSIEGGNYESYRDMFSWSSTPSVAAFQNAVQSAFSAWTVTDPVSGLGTSLSFVDDTLGTPAVVAPSQGAEIDLFAGSSLGSGITGGVASVGWQIWGGDVVQMTTGDVRGQNVMAGADITMNNNGATWTLSLFEKVLTHEIGHAIGLADVEDAGSAGEFIDDNFDGTTASLENSFAAMINTAHPEATVGISKHSVVPALFDADDPGGTDAPFLLMETNGDPGGLGVLGNDAFAGRQYLYPVAVPEPRAWALIGVVASVMSLKQGLRHRKRRKLVSPR